MSWVWVSLQVSDVCCDVRCGFSELEQTVDGTVPVPAGCLWASALLISAGRPAPP